MVQAVVYILLCYLSQSFSDKVSPTRSHLHVARTITTWTKVVPDGVLHDINRPYPGRPKKFGAQDQEHLKLMFLRGKASTASAATRELIKENIDPVRANTVRRALQGIGGKAIYIGESSRSPSL
ncbi:MAG: hypothetical protein J3Q66DRAFT_361655 [Benniella sp.]|nr:MAG: hypothetical protein J3Q66DRAFT_361655 [Benniella sp.]